MPSLETSVLCFTALLAASCASAQQDGVPGYRLGQEIVACVRGPEEAGEASSVPMLRVLQGRVPLARVSQRPSDRWVDQPSYEFAVFDDGTIVYEGDRCVRLGGLIIKRLDVDDLHELKTFLEHACTSLPSAYSGEVCVERPTVLRVTCSNGENTLSTNDRCLGDRTANATVATLAQQLLMRVGAAEWIGELTERQACTSGASALAPGALRTTVQAR